MHRFKDLCELRRIDKRAIITTRFALLFMKILRSRISQGFSHAKIQNANCIHNAKKLGRNAILKNIYI